MKKLKSLSKNLALFMAGSILISSCGSSTLIMTNPPDANVYLDGQPVGVTPYRYTDTKIVGSINNLKLEKEGFEPINTSFSRNEEADVGAIIGGIFFLFPFLWTMKYKPTHEYELIALSGSQKEVKSIVKPENPSKNKSKAERLRELKQLLDEKILTQEEYNKEKKKILDEEGEK